MAAQTALIKRQKIICEVISESKVAAIAEKNDRDIEYIEVFALHSISLRHVFDELRSLSIDWLRIQSMPASHLSVLNVNQGSHKYSDVICGLIITGNWGTYRRRQSPLWSSMSSSFCSFRSLVLRNVIESNEAISPNMTRQCYEATGNRKLGKSGRVEWSINIALWYICMCMLDQRDVYVRLVSVYVWKYRILDLFSLFCIRRLWSATSLAPCCGYFSFFDHSRINSK